MGLLPPLMMAVCTVPLCLMMDAATDPKEFIIRMAKAMLCIS